jgi:hypothetical protein
MTLRELLSNLAEIKRLQAIEDRSEQEEWYLNHLLSLELKEVRYEE